MVTKIDETKWPKGSTKSSKSSHWASMVDLFEMLGGFERMCFLMSFWICKKSAHNSKTNSDFYRQIEKTRLVWSWSTGKGGVPGKGKSWVFED